jgi:hypothetical protein
MNFQSLFKKALPHIGVLAFFYLLTFIYFKDVALGSKRIAQGDVVNYLGVSKEIVDYQKKGEKILWTNSLFCGMPTFQIHTEYPSNLMVYVDKIFSALFPHPIYNVFLYMVGFYILMLVLKVNFWLAIMGSLGFAFSSYFFIILEAGHNSKAHAIAYMAPVLAGIILTYRGKLLAGAALTLLFLGLEIKANHLQMTYYLFMLLGLLGLMYFIYALREKWLPLFFKASGVILAVSILAVGLNAGLLMATYDYSKYTIRGKSDLTIGPDMKKLEDVSDGLDSDYALAWSYGVGETMTLLVPNFKGGSSGQIKSEHGKLLNKTIADPQIREAAGSMNSYFGDMPFTSGPVYAGSIIVFLFLLGAFFVKGPLKWALLGGAILTIMLSWGRNFSGLTDLFLESFPGYNKFRSVSSILVIPELIFPLLGVLGLDRIIKNPGFLNETFGKYSFTNLKVFFGVFGFTAGLTLLCWLSPGMFTSFSGPDEMERLTQEYLRSNSDVTEQQVRSYLEQVWPSVEEVRESIVSADALRSTLFILVAGGLIFFFYKGKINAKILGISLAALVLVDLALVDLRYLSSDNFVKKKEMENPFAGPPYYRPHFADQVILEDKDYFRVYNQFARLDQDAATCYFHKSLSGYHGAKLKRYQELIDFHLNRGNMAAFNMLNTRYFITRGPEEQGGVSAMKNPGALGPAWFVNEVKWVASADSEIVSLSGFNPAKTAVIDQKFKESLKEQGTPDSTAGIVLESYHPMVMKYKTTASADQLAVFSEIYYPSGWNAYIDGKAVPHGRANYVLRALNIPAGNHEVEFRFEPSAYYTGEKISMISSILALLLFGTFGFFEWRKRKTEA